MQVRDVGVGPGPIRVRRITSKRHAIFISPIPDCVDVGGWNSALLSVGVPNNVNRDPGMRIAYLKLSMWFSYLFLLDLGIRS